jgi:hypothetical protein
MPDEPNAVPPTRLSLRKRIAILVGSLLLLYLAAAYFVVPELWKRYVRRHPALDDTPGITTTANGIPGDPINVGLVGTEAELTQIMRAANWHRADPLGLRSDLEIAEATVLKREYTTAPVSNLYFWGRKEDLAFEQPAGPDPRKRHHVRFWRSEKLDSDNRPLWVGSATFDVSVGLSHTTGQITHHIDSDIDAERDHLFRNLDQTGNLVSTYGVDNFHEQRSGRNGGGDGWTTDGRLLVGVIRQDR